MDFEVSGVVEASAAESAPVTETAKGGSVYRRHRQGSSLPHGERQTPQGVTETGGTCPSRRQRRCHDITCK